MKTTWSRIRRIFWSRAARVDFIGSPGRIYCLRRAGITIGAESRVMAGTRFVRCTAQFGSTLYIAPECFFEDSGPLIVESGVSFGPRCIITTATHDCGPPDRRVGALTPMPIKIGEGSAIGAGTIILPGVTIGPGCVVAAGSVVTQNCEPNSLYAGVPAMLKKHL